MIRAQDWDIGHSAQTCFQSRGNGTDQDPRTFMSRVRALGSPCLHSVLSSPIIFISFSSSTVFFISYIHHVFSFSFPCPQPQSKFCDGDGLTYISVLAICFLACAHAKLLQSCPTLCNPMDCSPPVCSVHEILQARTLE